MSQQGTISVLVDDLQEVKVKGAFPLPNFEEALQKVAQVGIEKLRDSVSKTLAGVFFILSDTTLESGEYAIDTIRFSLNIDMSGEVSLVSLLKGSVGEHTGLEFTIVRRPAQIGSN